MSDKRIDVRPANGLVTYRIDLAAAKPSEDDPEIGKGFRERRDDKTSLVSGALVFVLGTPGQPLNLLPVAYAVFDPPEGEFPLCEVEEFAAERCIKESLSPRNSRDC